MLPLQLMLEKTLEANRLFDFYDSLLTEKQRQIFRLYFREDWSLSEIAEARDCSRQAVHETVQRGLKKLQQYDDKLSLIDDYERRQSKLRTLLDCLDDQPSARSIVEELITIGEK